ILNGNTGVETTGGNGVGMRNVIQRLSLFFNRQSRFEIISEGPGMGTEVVITIPMEQKGETYV
ncbi:MAG: histidine kinase, partial [Lachnospiraceae bacterium]|nr:histidine kinase [Lachnospiraceae bacterium]